MENGPYPPEIMLQKARSEYYQEAIISIFEIASANLDEAEGISPIFAMDRRRKYAEAVIDYLNITTPKKLSAEPTIDEELMQISIGLKTEEADRYTFYNDFLEELGYKKITVNVMPKDDKDSLSIFDRFFVPDNYNELKQMMSVAVKTSAHFREIITDWLEQKLLAEEKEIKDRLGISNNDEDTPSSSQPISRDDENK